MQCPLNNERVNKLCENSSCWYNNKNAKNNCAVKDTGNSHLLIFDIARIYKEDIKQATNRVERGREKIKYWLKLVNFLETIFDKGCNKCGKTNCANTANCFKRREKISQLKDSLPLENLLKMYPSRWYAAAKFVEENNILNSIKI